MPQARPLMRAFCIVPIQRRASSRADGTVNNDTIRSWGLCPRRSGDPKCVPLSRPVSALSRGNATPSFLEQQAAPARNRSPDCVASNPRP